MPSKPAAPKAGGKQTAGGKAGDKQAPPEGNRFLLWLTTTMALWALWFGFLQPMWFPNQNANQPVQAPPDIVDRGDAPPGFAAAAPPKTDDGGDEVAPPELPEREVFPARTVELGGFGKDAAAAGYLSKVTLDSRGASVKAVALNDGRYRELADRDAPLLVIGNGETAVATFDTQIDALNAALAPYGTTSAKVDWELAETLPDPENPAVTAGAVWRLEAPDGSFEAVKTYRLRTAGADAAPAERNTAAVRDGDPRGYLLDLDLTLRNRSEAARTATFTLQGPVGLPLENEANTRKFREIELAYYEGPGDLETTSITATAATDAVKAASATREADAAVRRLEAELRVLQTDYEAAAAAAAADPRNVNLAAAERSAQARIDASRRELDRRVDAVAGVGGLEEYRQPIKYVGTEVQYFTALAFPRPDAGGGLGDLGEVYDSPIVASLVPQVVAEPDREDAQKNDVSVRLTSTPVELAAGAEATRSFTLFAGPKRPDLLDPLGAGDVMDLGWFGFIGHYMLVFLTFAHDLGLPYWLAIISLTVLVRCLMFPLSKRTALMAAKQKALAPKIAEIKARCGEDMQAAGREQFALMNRHGVNPLMGCLPVFFTIPVFIALYNALLNSVDLRLAEFLWIDNLAAPDNLVRLPFDVYYIGSYLNLFPVLLAGLWFFQQKLFMPPAQTPEQEMQYKLMGYMMPLSSLFIYHLPAGWCLYSIASALWTVTERKLLERTRNASIEIDDDPEPKKKGPVGRAVGRLTEKPMARLKEKLAEAAAAAEAAQKEATTQQIGSRRDAKAGRDGAARNVPLNGKAARRAAGRGGRKKKSRR